MTHTTERTHRTGRTRRGALARLLLAIATVIVLAGCVMPDGTVYTLPADAPSAQTGQPAEPAEDDVADDEPSPAQPFFDEGDAALDAGDIEAALEAFSQAIEADPDAPYGFFRRGLSYAYMGDLETALADLDQAVLLAPDNVYNYNLRGELRINTGDMAGAVEDYERVVELASGGAALEAIDRLRAHYLSSQARMALGDLTGAVDDLRQALRFNPLAMELYGEYRRLAGSAELMDEKVAEYERFAEESDSPGAAEYAEGMKQLLLGQLAQSPDAYGPAVEALTAAIDADPELANAYHARGIARIGAAALEQLIGTVHVGPDSATYTDPETGEQVTVSREEWDADWELQQQVADAARAEAIEDVARAVELDPENAEFVYDLGVAHFAQQEALYGSVYAMADEAGREQALALFDEALELAPEWDQARLSRAIASVQWGTQDGYSLLGRESAAVADVTYADDNSIVVLYEDTTFDRWDAESGELLESNIEPVVADAEYSSIALSPDAASVAVSNYVDGIRIWDRTTGEELPAFEGYEAGNERATFSADGTRVAAAGRESVNVWDTKSGEMLLQSVGSEPVALSPDGSQLVTGGGSNPDLTVLDASTGVTVTALMGPVDGDNEWAEILPYAPESVAFSPNGERVAAVGRGGAIRVWDLGENEEARVLNKPGDTNLDWYLDFSPDGTMIVASTSDGRMAVHDVETGEQLSLFGEAVEYGTSEYAPTFSPDGTTVVSATPGGALNFRDPRTGELLDTWQRDRMPEEDALEQSANELLRQAIEDANLLVEHEYGAGWPYIVRASARLNQAEFDGRELDADEQEQIEADWQAFTQLSPDVRQDDWISYMPGQVRFSSPVAPADPLMAGRIEHTDDGRTLIHEAEGFQMQIPAQGPTGRVVDIYVPGGPAFVRILDDFRDFTLIVMDGDLGGTPAEEWLAEMLLEPSSVESIGSLQTELGEAYTVTQRDSDLTAVILPVDGRIFYLSYTPGWIGSDHGFADGYGLKLGPKREVAIDFLRGLSLLEE